MNFVDPNGKDYRYHSYQDDKGKWHLDITSKIHVFSDKGNVEQKVNEYNMFGQVTRSIFSGNSKAADGTDVAVSINVQYVVGKRNESGQIRDFSKGDNELSLVDGAKRNNNMGALDYNIRKNTTGNRVVMDSSGDYYSSPATVLHDLLHQLGFGDRYDEGKNQNVRAHPGFIMDLMGLGPQSAYQKKGFDFLQVHFDDAVKGLFNKNQQKLGLIPGSSLLDKAVKRPIKE